MALGTPVQYKRLYEGPLDADSVFETFDEANAYAQSATSYAGQILAAKTEGEWKAYMIMDDKSLADVTGGKSVGGAYVLTRDEATDEKFTELTEELVDGALITVVDPTA